MKRKWFHAQGDPLYLTLLLVMSLFFVAVLAVCFSFLIASGGKYQKTLSPSQAQSGQALVEKDGNIEKAKLLKQEIRVGEISGQIVEVQGNKIVFEAAVYGKDKKLFAIALDEEDQLNVFKFVELEGSDEYGLPKIEKTKFVFNQVAPGNHITLRFPLEVPVSEIENGTLQFEEILIDDEKNDSGSESEE